MAFFRSKPIEIIDNNLSPQLDSTRIQFVKMTSHITQERYPLRQVIHELAYLIIVHLTYDDDMKIDRDERETLSTLYQAILQSLNKKEQKSFKRTAFKYVSKNDIISYIEEKELPPSSVLKAVNIVESNLELSPRKITILKELYETFTTLY